jgi:hypothetical protein
VAEGQRFDPAMVAELEEAVQRNFTHALAPGAPLSAGVRLTMTGGASRSVSGCPSRRSGKAMAARSAGARAGWGPAKALHVVDRYAHGSASMDVRLLGRIPLVHADDEDTARSGAGRAAVKAATWAPGADRGIAWRAESNALIAASWDVPPERPEVQVRIDEKGAVRSASALRWDNGDHGLRGYIPCGGEVEAEQRFGDLVLASRVTVGRWFATPRWAPFFRPTSSPPNCSHSAVP